jgi:hypothetical protein
LAATDTFIVLIMLHLPRGIRICLPFRLMLHHGWHILGHGRHLAMRDMLPVCLISIPQQKALDKIAQQLLLPNIVPN